MDANDWPGVWDTLEDFFDVTPNGVVSQKRVTKELKQANHNREMASINGAKGGRPPNTDSKPVGKPIGNPEVNLSKTSSPSPSLSPVKEEHDFNKITDELFKLNKEH